MTIDVADRLAEIMTQKKFSQYRLGKATGISQSAISSILLKKKAPRVETLRKLLEAMGVSETEFYQGSPTTPPENKKTKDLDEFLRQSDIMFQGVPLSDEAKEGVRKILSEVHTMAKEMNRRKPK